MPRKKTRSKVCLSILSQNLEKLKKISESEFNTLSGKVNAIIQNALNEMDKQEEQPCNQIK